MRITIILLALFLIACKSTIGGGQIKAEKVNDNLTAAEKDFTDADDDFEEAEEQAEKSSATPEQKAGMKKAIQSGRDKVKAGKEKVNEQKPAITEIGKGSDINKEIADANAADAAKYRRLVIFAWIASGIIGLGLAVGLYLGIRNWLVKRLAGKTPPEA